MNEKTLIRVVAREGIDLEELSQASGPLLTECGTAGPSIAQRVRDGNGVAEIKLSLLALAVDTQSGIEAIFDNFAVYESKTKAPLILSLLKQKQ